MSCALIICEHRVGYVVATIGYLLALVDFFVRSMIGGHVTYFALSRVDWTMLAMAPSVVPQYFYGGMIATVVVLYGQYRFIRYMKTRQLRQKTRLIVSVVLIGALAMTGTAKAYINMSIAMSELYSYQALSMEEIKQRLGMERYSDKSEVTARAGKNIVVIYMESLENNFLDEKIFPHEMTNIHRLQREGWRTYDNYICAYGAGWTIGGIYATQTGLPTMFSSDMRGNSVFNLRLDTKAVSYPAVLACAGYQNVFVSNCNLEFGGTGAMMRSFGYQIFGGEAFAEDIQRTKWGVHDAHGFAKAKEEYRRLSNSGQPFQLTILTVDTHYPNGLPDESMRAYVDERIPSGTHEYVVATLDWLVGDFVRFIEAQPNGKDTVIVLTNDHLMMREKNEVSIVDKLSDKPRHNLFMTNRPIPNRATSDEIAFWDMPSVILSLAEVEHNVRFPVDCNPRMSEAYIKEHESLFSIFNMKLMQ